ncbi:homocysteine S-methyltransferase family protein [Mogibacterium sp. NSJ-24]|uniref:Methionine synthase n=2 Tax=Lentihominibacter hominis TaxID=2763645 RepID=A0A926EAA2_9FIRM|nr:homocysteine S-methyltransferase family protein [Lentihominibacter hominis]
MGTMLQKAGMNPEETTTQFGLKHPEIWYDIFTQYINAGADIIYAGTFGINKFKADELDMSLEEAVVCAMNVADRARNEASKASGRDVKIALGIGPLGELLEPMGTLTFEEAYDAFSQIVNAGKNCGADLVVIETMTDLYEVKAAVLAVKENSKLPVMVSMTFEENERTFTGVSLEAMALTLEGLGVDAMGINCSLGPVEILPMARKLRSLTSIPVFAKPNAGLPDPETGKYDISCDQFIDTMKEYIDCGINMVGGCCGTTPEYISGIARYRDSLVQKPQKEESIKHGLRICSSTDVVTVDHVTVIGERINPTGKKRLKQALLEKDFDYILNQAIEQIDAGAEILDVNVGVPSLDDVEMLPEVIKKLQSVTGLPLQIDSSNPKAIEAALRVYNGKAIVNSVNGEPEVMDSIFPIVKKYGAAVIGLTLDSAGIPDKAEDRFAIAQRILDKALEYGIPREDLIIDCLTLTVSAQQKEAGETLKAVRMIKDRLGLKTALGVSNISFGLPMRILVNRTFLAMAMECGLDLPIINPNDEDMMSAVFAFNVLKNVDENAVRYIERYGDCQPEISKTVKKRAADSSDTSSYSDSDIFYCIEKGMKADTVAAVKKLLENHSEMELVNDFLIPALDNVGQGFEKGTIFLPQMLQAATAAQAGFDIIKTRLAESDKESVSLGEVVIATVKGDIHDIGKNIVKVIMENYGYKMIDLGRDVPSEKIVETVVEKNIKLVGLSALMTTTLKSMEETIIAVKTAAPDCRIMVGGAVLTADYAEKIGADFYCKDAMKSVEAAQEVFG